MKKYLFLLWALPACSMPAKEDPTELAQPIVEEGKMLYRSEMASWYGTDLFRDFYREQDKIGGYFSYADKDKTKCIFFSNADTPEVIGTITFDSTFIPDKATIELAVRPFTDTEEELYTIRTRALYAMVNDSFFRRYEKTDWNLVPLISNNEKKVYVLTGPAEDGVVILGNDYLLTFDKAYALVDQKRLHKSMLTLPYEPGTTSEGGMHTHLPETGDFITATDICTLMLYGKYTGWKQHIVVSDKYVNIWDCTTNKLTVIPAAQYNKTKEGRK
ncbi:hypothetical protein [Taibaiella chishuiensis]|uniref:Uncharacterized protein n=1 Tax=Taibaiella chishuiensis TaxID=1434707 RepID=A0A2P8D0K5_9BACT|nr:hypothetical protein [Taibaiella chishuiensis]PSK90696.1 hypothetical protein B0I18_107106 [Taibaiella chishuiensis]